MNTVKIILLTIFLLLGFGASAQMDRITEFGTNPGNLDMFLFKPSNPKTNAEVVLVLHGCGQTASNFAEHTGWNVLAQQFGFYVVFAQQKAINNPTRCFNWFLNSDNERDYGEAKSLIEMVGYVHENFSTDETKSFVCGLSAGGAMTPVMLACYPDEFMAGGTWAGVPYLYRGTGNNDLSPVEWGDRVRDAYPSYAGTYPTLFICQGKDDAVTELINESRLIAQWTNIHDSDQMPDAVNFTFNDNPVVEEKTYLDSNNDAIVKSYVITNMGHGIAVDPGSGTFQGGQTSPGAFDVDFYSTYWMARFFGIITNDIVNSVDQLPELEIKAYISRDGSLKIKQNENYGRLHLVLFDALGRLMLKEDFNGETSISSNRLRGNKILILSVVDNSKEKVYSKIIVR